MKILLAIFLAALGFSLPASATTYSVDYTDIWYNAPAESESGWGVNIIQQNEVLFVTLFVYGTDGSPRWYVGPNVFASNTITYGGTLYSVVGSYFGAPWNPPSTASPVGSINFSFASPNSGILSYNVNGVTVTKNITRQTFKGDNLGGNYIGGTTARGSACGGNGGILISGELTVSHNNTAIGMTVDFVSSGGLNSRCTYAGTYEQAGRLGAIKNGTFNCTIGTTNNALVGNFEVTEITTSRTGFTGAFAGQDQFCAYSGFFGGTKDVF